MCRRCWKDQREANEEYYNLPPGSVNCWLDFEELFVSNFSSTYKRPNKPHTLALCQQKPNEPDRDFLTRWYNVRNSCERVIESQAIAWFAQGCIYGSMLWQRLQRDMPTTLAETIRIADFMPWEIQHNPG